MKLEDLRKTPRTDSLERSLGHHTGDPAVAACLRHAKVLERELRLAEYGIEMKLDSRPDAETFIAGWLALKEKANRVGGPTDA